MRIAAMAKLVLVLNLLCGRGQASAEFRHCLFKCVTTFNRDFFLQVGARGGNYCGYNQNRQVSPLK
jgi:hypothetical protein